jgi:PIN domain nuclease of toxin-antitoxin system
VSGLAGPKIRLTGVVANALPVTIAHAEAAGSIEWHHRDPFDRMLVAQAAIEQAVLVSNDRALEPYGVPLVW